MLFRGVVDENIELAEFLHSHRDSVFAKARVTEIPRNGHATPAELFNCLFRRTRILVLIQINDRNVRALASEQYRRRPADTAVASRHQRHAALQFIRWSI